MNYQPRTTNIELTEPDLDKICGGATRCRWQARSEEMQMLENLKGKKGTVLQPEPGILKVKVYDNVKSGL